MPYPAPSPATAPSVRRIRNRSVYTSSLAVPSAARPRPRHAPCWITSLLLERDDSSRKVRMLSPWLAWMRPRAYSAPPSVQGLTLVHWSAQLEPCLTHKKPYSP